MKLTCFVTRNPFDSMSTAPRQTYTKRPSLLCLAAMSSLLFAPGLASRTQAQSVSHTLTGTITLPGWSNPSYVTDEKLTFTLADQNSSAFIVQQVPYASNGSFSLTVPAGNYKIAVKADRYLQVAPTGTVDLTSSNVSGFVANLLSGDVDGNNLVNVDDLSLLLLVFNTTKGDGTYELTPTADLNGDGFINVDDLSILLYNFNVAGDPTPLQNIGLSAVTLSSYAPTGPTTITGTVYLNAAAPAGGVDVRLASSNNSLASIMSPTLHIAANATKAEFLIAISSALTTPNVTITATSGAGSIDTQLDIHTPIQLISIGSSSGRNALYWHGFSGAIGYNIYRSLTSGGTATKINSSPVTTLDPGPGMTNAYLYKDMGLTNGTEYFYYVVVVNSGNVEGVRSNETSATPDADAIPWDTSDATQIIGAIATNDALYRAEDEVEPDEYAACGPNGVVYRWVRDSISTPQAFVPDGFFDTATKTVTNSNGTSEAVPLDRTYVPDPMPGPSFRGYGPTKIPSGIFRKVESTFGGRIFRGDITLPLTTSPPYCQLDQGLLGVDGKYHGDEGYIYTGGNMAGVELDVCLQLGHAGNVGWIPYALGVDGDPVLEPVLKGRLSALPDIPVHVTFIPPGFYGVKDGHVQVKYQAHFKNQDIPSENYTTVKLTYVIPKWYRKNLPKLRIKRMNSIAQTLPATYGNGYRFDSSYINGAGWNNLTLDGFDWDLYLTSNSGAYPGTPQVTWSSDNPFFNEKNINMKATSNH